MNSKPTDEERITRWIDGDLGDDDVRDLLEADPSLAALKSESLAIGDDLRKEFSAEEPIPYSDFFNHQVRRRIEEEDAANDAPITWKEESQVFPLFTKLRTVFGFAFLAMLVGIVTWGVLRPIPADTQTHVVRAFAPNPEVTVTTDWSDDAEATIIVLDGLLPIAADDSIAGVLPPSTPDLDWQVNSNTLLATLTF